MALGLLNPSNNTQDFSQAFVPNTQALNNVANTGRKIGLSVGYSGDVGWKVPTNQLCSIISSGDLNNPDGINVITAIMEKPFSMSTSSNWQSLIGVPTDVQNQIATSLSGGKLSGYSIYSTRRIWAGSEPISLNLSLKFYAVHNTFIEVVSPCIRLQRLSLPSYQAGNLSLLTPPGPNPYNLSATTPTVVLGDNIEIYVGGFLYFNPVIVKRVSVEWDNKYDSSGYPLGATVQVEFQTYQIMTKVDISNTVQPSSNGNGGGPLAQPNGQVGSILSILTPGIFK